MQADQEDIKGRQGTNDEGNLPAKGGNQEIGNAGGHQPAYTPKAFEQDDETAAQMCRRVFAHQGCGNRQFTAKAKAYEETEHEQGFIAPGQSAHSRGQTVEQNG